MRYKENSINNIEELRLEIVRLKLLAKSQETYLEHQYELVKEKVNAPLRFINGALSWIPGVDFARELFGNDRSAGKKDWVSRIFSAGSIALVNRLFLRKAGLFTRILMSTFTRQAAGMMNKERANHLIKLLADFISPSVGKAETASDPISEKRTSSRKRVRERAKVAAQIAEDEAFNFGIPPESETS